MHRINEANCISTSNGEFSQSEGNKRLHAKENETEKIKERRILKVSLISSVQKCSVDENYNLLQFQPFYWSV